ncbi:MAG: hypothetical protein H0W72_11650, partial [Planctomycetes bacterium]|nr:hypothetical protein [Planctomycetota bacterium]
MAALKPSLAHARSQRFVIDPGYRTAVAPPVSTAPWLFLWGDLEAWLLARLRHDGFHDCRHVFHPGLFRGWSPHAIFSHHFT